MVDNYRNLKFILDTLAPLRIKNKHLSDAWNLLQNVRLYRTADPESRSDEQRKAIEELPSFYSEHIGKLTEILSQHFPQLVAGLQEVSEKVDQQWSLTLQQASAENASRSRLDEAWTTQYSELKDAYSDYQKQVQQASKPSKHSSHDPKAREFELALDRYTLVSGHSPIIQKMEAAKQALEPMIEFESRLRPLKESYRVPLEGMLAEVEALLPLEPSASHHHYHRHPMKSRATSYAMLKEQLEYLLDNPETSPLNVSPKWNSVRARGIDETLKTFDETMTHHFATLSEDMRTIARRHQEKEAVFVAPAKPEIEMADAMDVKTFVKEGREFLKKMEKSWLQYDRKDELKTLIKEQLSKIKTPMPAEDFQKLKAEYREAHDRVMAKWNQSLKRYYSENNPRNSSTLATMAKNNISKETNVALDIFKARHDASLNDANRERWETLNADQLTERENTLRLRTSEMKSAHQRFEKHYRAGIVETRLNDPVYQNAKQLIQDLTTLYNKASTSTAEKQFIHYTVLKLEVLVDEHRQNTNRDPIEEKKLRSQFRDKIVARVDKRIEQLEKLKLESTPTPARKTLKALLKKASAVFKRRSKKQPAQPHVLPEAEAAFREFREQVNPATSMTQTPAKTKQ